MTSPTPVGPGAAGGLAAGSLASSLWRRSAKGDFAREGVVVTQDDRARMLERHRLVVSIIDVNSRQMRCDGAIAGLEIDRARLQRDMQGTQAPVGAGDELAAVEERMRELIEQRRKLALERQWLDAALAEFDSTDPRDAATHSGRA